MPARPSHSMDRHRCDGFEQDAKAGDEQLARGPKQHEVTRYEEHATSRREQNVIELKTKRVRIVPRLFRVIRFQQRERRPHEPFQQRPHADAGMRAGQQSRKIVRGLLRRYLAGFCPAFAQPRKNSSTFTSTSAIVF